MLEIEVKIKVPDLEAYKKKIMNRGAKLTQERFFEKNTLYDFRSQTLSQKRQALRIREIGKKTLLSFKDSPQKSRNFKIRREFETEIKNRKQLKKILKSLGLVPVFSYNKQRTIYRKGHLKICLDETEAGHFLEFEGERQDIVKFAKQLGFSRREFINLDYIKLIMDVRAEKLRVKAQSLSSSSSS